MVEKQERRGDFNFRHIGKNHIAIYPHKEKHTNNALTQSGSDIKYYIDIPYFHRIVKLVLLHLTSAFAKSTDEMKVALELEVGKSIFSPKFSEILFYEERIVDAEITELYGNGFEYEPRTWTLTLNSTSTDLIIPVLYIQKENA